MKMGQSGAKISITPMMISTGSQDVFAEIRLR